MKTRLRRSHYGTKWLLVSKLKGKKKKKATTQKGGKQKKARTR